LIFWDWLLLFMEFYFFALTWFHVATGLIFCGLPVLAFGEVLRLKRSDWNFVQETVQHSIAFGVATMAIGVLIGGAKWDRSFEVTWDLLRSRWVFAFIEFGFSVALLLSIVHLFVQPPKTKVKAWVAGSILLVAATNLIYHFPSLMVISRAVRMEPELLSPGNHARDLIFGAPYFWRWIHIAVASIMFSSVWARFGLAMEIASLLRSSPEVPTGNPQGSISLKSAAVVSAQQAMPNDSVAAKFAALDQVDRRMRVWLLSGLVGLWTTGLLVLLNLPIVQLNRIAQLGGGKSNLLMIGVVLATWVGLRSLMESNGRQVLWRLLDLFLMLATVAMMVLNANA